MKKKTLITIPVTLLAVILFIPSLIALPFHGHTTLADGKKQTTPTKKTVQDPSASIPVAVYRTNSKSIDDMTLHNYLVGVVASEMPADFEMEALKAQTLAARTYIVNRLINPPGTNSELPKGAIVNDTISNQVYKSKEELKKIWGSDYNQKIKRVEQAVTETEGEIITFKGQIIGFPAFFSTSNGYTENSEDYYETKIPYLRSVPSKWDLKSPKYKATTTMTVSDVQKDLGVTLPLNDGTIGSVRSLTKGKRIAEIVIGGKAFTGRQVRESLNLRSSDFKMIRSGNNVMITTYGYGHGVGMSQYGANGLAKQGKTCGQIVEYYYTGVKVSSMDSLMGQIKGKI